MNWKHILTNWKTSLGGFLAGISSLSINGMNPKSYLLALAFAALGAVAKDGNVTGGTVKQ